MQATFSIALTGGIGSGKTTLGRMMAELGAALIDLDAIAHQLTAAGGAAISAIRCEFGDPVIGSDGALDRARLRSLVFGDPQARARLEALLHPLIWQQARRSADALGPGTAYRVFDVPLLTAESVRAQGFDRVLVVDCPVELQVARAVQRSHLDRDQVEAIVAAQPSRADRLALADDVVFNGDGIDALRAHARRLHALYCSLAAARTSV